MGGCYVVEVWQSGGNLGSYDSKFKMSAFIDIETSLVGPILAKSLASVKVK